MPQNLVFWGMLNDPILKLLDREKEHLLCNEVRWLDLPNGKKRFEAFRLVWNWYDNLRHDPYGIGEERMLHYLQRCIDEEQLEPNDAIVRYVCLSVEMCEEDGIDVLDDGMRFKNAQDRLAKWLDRKPRKPSGKPVGK